MRISLRTPLLCSHPKSVCEVSGWRAERHFIGTDSSYFITSLFTWSKTRSSAVPAGDTASCWRSGICDPQLKTQKGISDDLSFPGSCAATEKKTPRKTTTWEFVAIWRCLGNALSSSDLNCYSLYLQEFQLEAGILY